MDTIWTALGLEPTKDVSAIKRAYAEKAKTCHPEEDPEGFLQLRQAYQAALAWAENGETPPAAGPEAFSPERTEPEDEGWSLSEKPALWDEGPNPFAEHPAAVAFRELYTGRRRKDPKAWMDYFTSGDFLDVAWERRFAGLLLEEVTRLEGEYPIPREFLTWLCAVYQFAVDRSVYRDWDSENERTEFSFRIDQDAQFEGQTKAKLGNSEIRTLVNNIVAEKLDTFLEENPQVGRMILDKALTASRAREAAKKARESIRRKTALGGAAMPDKLRDCNENNPELTELYIVEGDSAGGSATQGRDSRFQAILPLWGKMLNVEKARADKVYGNDKLQPVITALGAGIGEEFDANKLRYHKVIIMADADVDGSHIRTLLLTFFFRFMRPLIEQGYVYSAVPPLFKLTRGKTTRVAYDEPERERVSAELRAGNPNAKVDISRFKGLGEMNPQELWETTMDPATRTLRRITLDDAVKADETFTILMGEKVEPRKEFIEKNAQYVVNLDY